MKKKKILFTRIIFFYLFPFVLQAQTNYVNPEFWTATDALGRTTPTERQVGSSKNKKYVGIFYWTWHTDANADFSPVMNISRILKEHPEAAGDSNNPAWKGIYPGVFWWDEPLFGYYRTTDDWVLRKHAQMLADAGIDVVFFDCTNADHTWKSSYMELLKVWEQARKDGVKTPQVAFILPFSPNGYALSSIKKLYEDLYKPGLYKDLWFIWNGKPLIMSYFEMLSPVPNDPAETKLRNDIKNFFTLRSGQPDYVNSPSRNDQWGWLENYPQHGYGKKANGGYEEVTVGVAQNANDASGGHWYAFNAPGTYGRSYTKARGQDMRPNAYLYGLNFQEQWSRAFHLKPDLVFVTGWNEWIAGRWRKGFFWTPKASDPPFSFVDEYDCEKSRDIEPVKSWGDNGDDYYMQLVDNVRKFKGMQVQEPASGRMTIYLDSLSDWSDVKPEYHDYKGDTMWRNSKGQGDSLVYINTTGRNDIVLAKIARDRDYTYFYVKTAEPLTPKTDCNWMRLWIDIDRNKATGWEGYDYVINRVSPGDSAVVEKSTRGWNWTRIGAAAYSIKGNALELKVKRALFGVNGKKLNFELKWSDNSENDGNIMDFYVNGDAAPDGRFNYIYTTINTTN